MTVSVVSASFGCGPGWFGYNIEKTQNQYVRKDMSKKEMTEEEALAAKYRKFDDDGNRIYDSLSYEQMQGVLKAMYSGKLEVIGPDGKPVKFDKGEE